MLYLLSLKFTLIPRSKTVTRVIVHCRKAGHNSTDSQYAAAGPKANYQASNQSSGPSVTYEVANRRVEEGRGNRASELKEPFPQYAVVEKIKKKNKVRFYNERALANESYLLIVTRSR